jgi:hypothetical protein
MRKACSGSADRLEARTAWEFPRGLLGLNETTRKMHASGFRLSSQPIIDQATAHRDWHFGDNINGPSLIAAPSWLQSPLGKYYLYFAHHRGDHIRFAWADHLTGPWTIALEGALRIEQTPFSHHIASPDVHVDEAGKRILMYYHGKNPDSADDFKRGNVSRQFSGLAESTDGVRFTSRQLKWQTQYVRLFRSGIEFYALAKEGNWSRLFRGPSWDGPFTPGPRLLPRSRHTAVMIQSDRLHVLYSRIGDAPEHIRVSAFDLRAGCFSERELIALWDVELLRPEHEWEGADLPILPSRPGPTERANQLRDPAVFLEGNHCYLVYSIAGESGLAIAQIRWDHYPINSHSPIGATIQRREGRP